MRPHTIQIATLLDRLLASHDAFGVMSEAAFLHTRAFDYSEAPLRLALEAGALGVSLSGKGPAVAAFTQLDEGRQVLTAWRRAGLQGRFFRTRPTSFGVQTH